MKARMGRGVRSAFPLIFNLGTRWMWVVSFTPWPLHSRGEVNLVATELVAGWAHNRSWCCGEEKNYLSLTEIQTPDRPSPRVGYTEVSCFVFWLNSYK